MFLLYLISGYRKLYAFQVIRIRRAENYDMHNTMGGCMLCVYMPDCHSVLFSNNSLCHVLHTVHIPYNQAKFHSKNKHTTHRTPIKNR